MQKTAKKFLSMLLALMMVLSILPTAVFATEQATVAAPLDSIVPYGANDQTTGTATISVQNPGDLYRLLCFRECALLLGHRSRRHDLCKGHLQRRCHTDQCHER